MKPTTRKLEAFVFSAHHGSKPVRDYAALIDYIINLPETSRVVEDEDGRVFAVPIISRDGNHVELVAYEGERGVNPLLFNTAQLSERIPHLAKAEVLATKTHAVIDLASRKSIIEYNHRGAKAEDISFVLTRLGRSDYEGRDLYLQFARIPGDDFIPALERLTRVRTAAVKFTRPNPGWTDAHDKLTDVAQASNADAVDVQFIAPRGAGLETDQGIIATIKNLAKDGVATFKKVEVTGFENNSTNEKKIKLDHHTENKRVDVPRDENGHPSEESIWKGIRKYLADLTRRN